MIKMLYCFIVVCYVSVLSAQDLDLAVIRKDFNKGVHDEDLCKKHYDMLKKNANSGTEKGYAAAYQMFMAKHTGNPIKKMSYFNGGKDLLERQLKSEPNNVELRFIRLCIQFHLPKYVGYRSNIEEDKVFLVNNLYKVKDAEVKDLLFRYLKGASIYTEPELVQLGR